MYVSLERSKKNTKMQLMPLDKRQDITCAFSSDAINIVITICKIYYFYFFTFILMTSYFGYLVWIILSYIFNLHNSIRYLVTSFSASQAIRSGLIGISNEGDVLFDKENGNNVCWLSYSGIMRLSSIISYGSLSKGRWFVPLADLPYCIVQLELHVKCQSLKGQFSHHSISLFIDTCRV